MIYNIRPLKWSEIHKSLFVFRHFEGGVWLLWGVPIAAIIVNVFNSLAGGDIKLPMLVVLLFAVALPYGIAQTIYALSCPDQIKMSASLTEWQEAAARQRTKYLKNAQINQQVRDNIRGTAEAIIEERLDRISPPHRFTDEEKKIIREEIAEIIVDCTCSVSEEVKLLGSSTLKNYDSLDHSLYYARLACSFFILTTVIISSIEIGDRALDVIRSSSI